MGRGAELLSPGTCCLCPHAGLCQAPAAPCPPWYLQPPQGFALAEEAFGPVGLEAEGHLRIPERLLVLLELLVAVRAVPEEPGGRAGSWLQALCTPAGTRSSVTPQRPAPCSPVLPGVQLHGLGEGLHCLHVVALLGGLVAVACRESIARCQPSSEAGSPGGGAERCPSTRQGHVCLLGTSRATERRWQQLRLHPVRWERCLGDSPVPHRPTDSEKHEGARPEQPSWGKAAHRAWTKQGRAAMCPPSCSRCPGRPEALTCKNQALLHHACVQGHRLSGLWGSQARQRGLRCLWGSQAGQRG